MNKYVTVAYSIPPLLCAYWDIWIWPFIILLLAAADISWQKRWKTLQAVFKMALSYPRSSSGLGWKGP